jgi:citrate lyase subunit beta/citryl-CoA lyase
VTRAGHHLRRMVLMTPGDNPRLIDRARRTPSDAVWLDLEDGVASARKAIARDLVASALAEHDWCCQELLVRVNSPADGGTEDLALLLETLGSGQARLDGIVLAKVNTAEDVHEISQTLNSHETARPHLPSAPLWCMIETPVGMVNINAIAAHPDVTAVVFGGGELRTMLGLSPASESWEPDPLDGARLQLVTAARAFGASAVDASFPYPRDREGSLQAATRTFSLGFDGKLVLSPSQIAPVLAAWAPSAAEVAAARSALAHTIPGEHDPPHAGDDGGRLVIPELRERQAGEILRRARVLGMAD